MPRRSEFETLIGSALDPANRINVTWPRWGLGRLRRAPAGKLPYTDVLLPRNPNLSWQSLSSPQSIPLPLGPRRRRARVRPKHTPPKVDTALGRPKLLATQKCVRVNPGDQSLGPCVEGLPRGRPVSREACPEGGLPTGRLAPREACLEGGLPRGSCLEVGLPRGRPAPR